MEILSFPYAPKPVIEGEASTWFRLNRVGTREPIRGRIRIQAKRELKLGATARVNDTATVSECLVRPSTPADIAAVTAIYPKFVTTNTATFEIVAPDEPEMMRRRQAVLDRGLPFLVAELEGYVVGFCYAAQFRPREGYRYTVEDSIYVRADCIGHGVGKMLLTELISECKARGCHSMVACICGVNVSSGPFARVAWISGGRLAA